MNLKFICLLAPNFAFVLGHYSNAEYSTLGTFDHSSVGRRALATLPTPNSVGPRPPYGPPVSGKACTVTEYAKLDAAIKALCKDITIQNLHVPSGKSIDLTRIIRGTVIRFAGKTTFERTAVKNFVPIKLGGDNVHITGTKGSIIDGNGPIYWDGKGSNGGGPKPNTFITVNKMSGSTIENLHIINWPVHLFMIQGSERLTIRNMILDNSAGDKPNQHSGKKAAAHNSDGFDIASSTNILLSNMAIYNQDDAVAISSGSHMTIDRLYCKGGHGLSIGSVGNKKDNDVEWILFKDSVIIDSMNGPRIKTVFDGKGSVQNVVFSNIELEQVSKYGIVVQQDYLNGGPTGKPTDGVLVDKIAFYDIQGKVKATALKSYILCSKACGGFQFDGVEIQGGFKQQPPPKKDLDPDAHGGKPHTAKYS